MKPFDVMAVDMSLKAMGLVAVRKTFAEGARNWSSLEEVFSRQVMTETWGLTLSHKATMREQLDRLADLRGHALDFWKKAGRPQCVVFEEYAFSASDSYAHAIGEAGGVAKMSLRDAGAWVRSVHVQSARKLLLGVGNLPSAKAKRAVKQAFEAVGYIGLTEAEYDALAVANLELSNNGLPCFASEPVTKGKRR